MNAIPKIQPASEHERWLLDWVAWPGGHRPHDPSTEVEIERRDGRIERGCSAFAHWWHEDSPDDIVAYRVVQPVAVVLDDFELWYFDLPPRKSTLPNENDCSDFDGAEWRI